MSIELLSFEEADLRRYLSSLVSIAHADGLHPGEEDYINIQSELIGIDPVSVWDKSLGGNENLSELPYQLKMILIRDAISLIYIDGKYTDEEQLAITDLAKNMEVGLEKVTAIESWLKEYWQLLERGEILFSEDN